MDSRVQVEGHPEEFVYGSRHDFSVMRLQRHKPTCTSCLAREGDNSKWIRGDQQITCISYNPHTLQAEALHQIVESYKNLCLWAFFAIISLLLHEKSKM